MDGTNPMAHLCLLLPALAAGAFLSPVVTSRRPAVTQNAPPRSFLSQESSSARAVPLNVAVRSTENLDLKVVAPTPADFDLVIDSYLSNVTAEDDGIGIGKAEATLLRVVDEYKSGSDDASPKPTAHAFASVVEAWLRHGAGDDSAGGADAAAAAARAESLLDRMEEIYEPDGGLYRKLINVWSAIAIRAHSDVISDSEIDSQEQSSDDEDESELRKANGIQKARAAAQHALKILDRMESLYQETGNNGLMPGVAQYKSAADAWKTLGTPEAADIIDHINRRKESMFTKAGADGAMVARYRLKTHKDVLDIIPQLGDGQLAKKLVYGRYGKEHPSVATSTFNYNLIIAALAKSGKVWAGQRAEDILDYMAEQFRSGRNKYAKPDIITINSCIDAWARSPVPDSAKRAEGILEKLTKWEEDEILSDVKADATSYNSVINAWCLSKSADATENAERVLARMEELYASSGDPAIKPDAVSFASVINALAKQSATEASAATKAEDLLKRMYQKHTSNPEENVAPNVRCFNAVLDAHSNSMERDAGRRAMKLLNLMEDMFKAGNQDLQPDLYSYNLVIKTLSDGRERKAPKRALELLERMEEWAQSGNERVKPDTITYNTVIDAFAKSPERGSADTAEQLFYRMKDLHKARDSVQPDAFTLASVINAWALSGERTAARRAEGIFEEVRNGNIKADTVVYNALLNCLAKSSDWGAPQRAEDILEYMEKEYKSGNKALKPDVRTYTSVIDALSKSRDRLAPKKAVQMLDRMEGLASAGDTAVRPNKFTYTAAMNCWARSRNPSKALQAQNLLSRMEEQYRRGNSSARPSTIAYNIVLNACAYTRGDTATVEEAFKIACLTFDELRTSEYLRPTHITYATFLDVCTKLMPEGDLRNDLVGNIFKRCCRDGNVSEAVIRRLRGVASADLYEKLLDGAPEDNLPREWTKNIYRR